MEKLFLGHARCIAVLAGLSLAAPERTPTGQTLGSDERRRKAKNAAPAQETTGARSTQRALTVSTL